MSVLSREYKQRENLKGVKPIGYRNSDYPKEFETLWQKRKHTDYKSRKEAAYALYLVIEKQLAQKDKIIAKLKVVIFLLKNNITGMSSFDFIELERIEKEVEELENEQ